MKIFISFFSFILFFIISCSTYNANSLSGMHNTAKSSLSGKVEYMYNNDSTFVVCIGDKKKFEQSYSFFVYSISKNIKVTDVYNRVNDVFWEGPGLVKYSVLYGTIEVGYKQPKYNTIEIKD